uniref:Uncharacterized protein n=1 Tax=Arion vulgaris TaxID=1028688 RepID=A0A0B7BC76_9EUPU
MIFVKLFNTVIVSAENVLYKRAENPTVGPGFSVSANNKDKIKITRHVSTKLIKI